MNAVFERDYVVFSSSTRFLLLRGGFAAAIGLMLFMRIWPAYFADDYSDVGSTLMQWTVWTGALAVALAAPGSLATVLVQARAANSLPVLLSTPLTPIGIAAGAFAARAGLLLLLVLATWPPIALALLFGGVRGAQLFEASAAIAATMFLLGAPALVISAFARRTAAAVVSAYLVAAGLLAALSLAGAAVASWSGDESAAAILSPYHAILDALSVSRAPDTFGASFPGSYVLFALSLTAAAAAVGISAWRLDREGKGGEVRARGGNGRCRPLRHENPVLDHELRRASLTSHRSPARWLLVLLLATEGVYVAWSLGGGDPQSILVHGGVLGFQLLLLVLAVVASGATALATEKETHTLPLLRAAPLRASEVVVGKLTGVMRALLPCLLVPLAHLSYAAFAGVVSPLAIPAAAVAGAITLTAWSICGLHQSLEQAEPRRAVARAILLLAIAGAALSGTFGVSARAMLGGADPYVRECAAFGANPIGSVLLTVAALRTGGSSVETARVPPPGAGDMVLAGVAAFVWLGLHVAFGAALYRRLARAYELRFDG